MARDLAQTKLNIIKAEKHVVGTHQRLEKVQKEINEAHDQVVKLKQQAHSQQLLFQQTADKVAPIPPGQG